MMDEILVAAGGTVTVNTEEYRELVERSAYLNVIMAFACDPKAYILSDITCIVKDLVEKKPEAEEDQEGTSEDTAEGAEDDA